MRSPALDRRDLLRAAATTAGLAALPALPAGHRAGAAGGLDPGGILVLLQLTGGNDGLATVVPYGDDAYAQNRRATRIGADEVLRLDEHVGLHPRLRGLRALFDEGALAIVQGCGYPRPSRSHFKSMEVWHAADPRGRAAGEGWIGRACDAAFARRPRSGRLVHVGGSPPFALHSPRHGTASFVVPAGYRWVASEDAVASYDERASDARAGDARDPGTSGGRLAFLRAVLSDARASSAAVRAAAARYRPTARYPDDPLAHDLLAAAAVIHGDLGARVVSVSLGGFDTHSGQRATHDALMRRLDAALGAFLADLGASEPGRATTVLAFSEFGRRVAENGSKGTDHGTAGPMLVAGRRVQGGLYGGHPSLTELADGDLVHTTDFRSVYGAVIEGCFGVRASDVLGAEHQPLPFLS